MRCGRKSVLVACLAGCAVGLVAARPSAAHLARWGSWPTTHANLMRIFPAADPAAWRTKRYAFAPDEVAGLERALGVALYPEDRSPEFYLAHNAEGRLLGVAIFIDPRPRGNEAAKPGSFAAVPMEVGVGVDPSGRIARVVVYDPPHPELAADAFLAPLRGRTLASTFTMGQDGLRAVAAEPDRSQLVASAAREALWLMKVALGRRSAP